MFILNIEDAISTVNGYINDVVWGPIMIAFILGTGLFLSIRLGFLQITKIKEIFKQTFGKFFAKGEGKGLVSSAEAALVSMGEIVGSGNIAGVATAVASGGPGAIVWMWIAAFFGMAIKYSEIVLGLLFRKTDSNGNVKGGPMYYIRDGVGSKFLAGFYAVMGLLSYIVIVAMVDTNTIVNAVQAEANVSAWIIAAVLVVIVGAVIFGGLKRIGKFSKWIVPIMGLSYIVCGLVVIITKSNLVGDAFVTIFKSAFSAQAAAGGFAGAAITEIMRYGFARGIYSNEAGLGTAAYAHSAAETKEPAKQALWGPVEVFVDTIIINTITGLIVTMSGLWTAVAADGSQLTGAALVMRSFKEMFPVGGNIIIMIESIMFSFTCLVSASYVCEESAEYLFGVKSKVFVKIFWLLFIIIGAVTELELVWDLADTVNGLMLIPNLIALLYLSGKVVKEKKNYFKPGLFAKLFKKEA